MRQRGRGAGPRQFGPGGGDAGRIGGGPVVPDSGPFGQIDTWNPVPEENANSVRRGKMSNRDAFDNAGSKKDILITRVYTFLNPNFSYLGSFLLLLFLVILFLLYTWAGRKVFTGHTP